MLLSFSDVLSRILTPCPPRLNAVGVTSTYPSLFTWSLPNRVRWRTFSWIHHEYTSKMFILFFSPAPKKIGYVLYFPNPGKIRISSQAATCRRKNLEHVVDQAQLIIRFKRRIVKIIKLIMLDKAVIIGTMETFMNAIFQLRLSKLNMDVQNEVPCTLCKLHWKYPDQIFFAANSIPPTLTPTQHQLRSQSRSSRV